MYYYAAASGNPYLMMHLLPYLEDINSKRYDNGHYFGMTLLFIASASGNAETVKVLLENGIDKTIYAKDAGGNEYRPFGIGIAKGDVIHVAVDDHERKRYPEYRVER
jgi:hypothetical protein